MISATIETISHLEYGTLRICTVDDETWVSVDDICEQFDGASSHEFYEQLSPVYRMLAYDEKDPEKTPMMFISREGFLEAIRSRYGEDMADDIENAAEQSMIMDFLTDRVLPMLGFTGGYLLPGSEEQFVNRFLDGLVESVREVVLAELVDRNVYYHKLLDDAASEMTERVNTNDEPLFH